MHLGRTIRRAAPPLVALLMLASGFAAAPVPAASAGIGPPSLRVLTATSHLTVIRPKRSRMFIDPGFLVSAVGGTFRLELHRDAIGGPIHLSQVWTDELLYEQNPDNDVALRRIVLQGRPGNRRLCVPPINGVDEEGHCIH